MSERSRLDSWKEIAGYLGRDVRTVIRWEQQRGLPIYRVPGGKLSRVFAYTDQLDAWLALGPSSEPVNEARPADQAGDAAETVLASPVAARPLPAPSIDAARSPNIGSATFSRSAVAIVLAATGLGIVVGAAGR